MNLIKKTILLFSSLLLLIGAAAFLFITRITPDFFIFYSTILIILVIVLNMIIFILSFFSKKRIDTKKLPVQGISDEANPVIFITGSSYFFDFFPDKFILQEKTLTIIRHKFFFNSEVETIPIKDIVSVRLYTGPIFVSISLTRRILPSSTIDITNLNRNEGIKFKEYLDALIMNENKLVKIPHGMKLDKRRKLILEIGREKEIEKEI